MNQIPFRPAASISGENPAKHSTKLHSNFSAGFSLIEIMVAMVIGLLGVIVIMQVFTLFEGQKRTTTGGADANNAGAISLYGIERDIRESGWNINYPDIIGCNATFPNGITLPLNPVTINPDPNIVPLGDANTDTLLIVSGNSNGASEGDIIQSQSATSPNLYPVTTPTAFSTGDLVIAQQLIVIPAQRPAVCNLIVETATVTSPKVNVFVPVGVASVAQGNLYNLGTKPKILAYAIRGGTLTVCDYMVNDCGNPANLLLTAVWVPIGDNIVSMRALYGRDTNTPIDGVVDVYDQTTPIINTVTTSCDWLKISAIQIVLVSRSAQPEKDVVTATAPLWIGSGVSEDGATPPLITFAAPILLTSPNMPVAAGYTWDQYRYKLFQTTIPLRNITSMKTLAKGVADC